MDADRFDAMARALLSETSRRRTLGSLLGGTLAALGLTHSHETRARSRRCKPECGECETCKKGECKRKNGQKVCKKGKCRPKADGTACSGGRVCQAGTCGCASGREFCGLSCGCCVPNAPVSGALPSRHRCSASSECCDGGACCNFDPPGNSREGPQCLDLRSHTSACGTTCENVVNCFNIPGTECVNGQCVVV
jgi:hypothetical protein